MLGRPFLILFFLLPVQLEHTCFGELNIKLMLLNKDPWQSHTGGFGFCFSVLSNDFWKKKNQYCFKPLNGDELSECSQIKLGSALLKTKSCSFYNMF